MFLLRRCFVLVLIQYFSRLQEKNHTIPSVQSFLYVRYRFTTFRSVSDVRITPERTYLIFFNVGVEQQEVSVLVSQNMRYIIMPNTKKSRTFFPWYKWTSQARAFHAQIKKGLRIVDPFNIIHKCSDCKHYSKVGISTNSFFCEHYTRK